MGLQSAKPVVAGVVAAVTVTLVASLAVVAETGAGATRVHLTVFGPPPPVVSAAAREPASERAPKERRGSKIPEQCPDRKRIDETRDWAQGREGSVSFAILDECRRLLGEHRFRVYYSASVVKAMLMVAYLRGDDVGDRKLEGDERDLLAAMIESSDNGAADTVFGMVGEAGLNELAADAEMRHFVSSPFWGGSGITAGDQASFLGRIERFVPRRHERFALRVLGRVIPDQRWGIAEVVPKGWEIHFKGGWYLADDGWRVNQVATLRRHDRAFAVAVLSDGNPSFMYGRETLRGVAKRLLADG